eukprot:Blabericola_migrator_1__9787@NODE_536_length_7757_cov_263_784395_g64_i2_p5_GENE_NODE_536_length_7757_cov_263_784395_g64_i2NODE_536_length_7757_cov_263_784395_g64_i2_p5_ORF_typecomplete_len209_score28_58Reticulon/PF02453_17/5_4e11Pex24p/PF06398_11/0_0079DUF4131/PF13567_6/20DUF4131/PF13567_6/0_048PRT_C/PF08372_10/24PRT_C/PF08372_10/1_7PhoR/PF11808_8/51PhoR/PF11808_8/3_8MASE2/PF05230_11/29MASE2/PF05230_11/2_7DUF4133/PF13571_6/42DUF4133/PF13571_6/9_3DUF4389/PF14333_6/3_8DUF4389/PF14333_6/90_NODE_536
MSGEAPRVATSGTSSLPSLIKSNYVKAASWENTYFSCGALCIANVFYLIYYLINLPILSLLAYTLVAYAALGLLVGRRMNDLLNIPQRGEIVSEQSIVEYAKQARPQVDRIAVTTRDVVCWADTKQSLLGIVVLLIFGAVLSRVSLSVLLILTVNVALIWTPATRLYKQRLAKQIEPHLHSVSTQISGVLNRIPMLTDRMVDMKTKKI